MNRGRTPKFPLSHRWVYWLSEKTFPAMPSNLALVGKARGGALGGLRRSGTPLAICFAGRLSPHEQRAHAGSTQAVDGQPPLALLFSMLYRNLNLSPRVRRWLPLAGFPSL
jgi:hypothetical protein